MICLLNRSLHTTYFVKVIQSKSYCNGIIGKDTVTALNLRSVGYKNESQLETKYPLFSDYKIYKKWLPVRLIKGSSDHFGYQRLYKLPHWVNEHDLEKLVNELEKQDTGVRASVKYLAAPGASGKTSAILPAFLRSAEREGGFTHYIYIAFKNNDSKTFGAFPFSPSKNITLATNQGASFMYNCENYTK